LVTDFRHRSRIQKIYDKKLYYLKSAAKYRLISPGLLAFASLSLIASKVETDDKQVRLFDRRAVTAGVFL
jgi:hypothetical protein